ncbi:MAG: hypothetical protein J3K34DRAFT_388271 [Monoraphidium minutum]|nr:MAG: hypothetical protein J3K34DRAFT_388271 [Monoraphidium minutum]
MDLPAGCSVRRLAALLGADLEAVEAALAELGDTIYSGARAARRAARRGGDARGARPRLGLVLRPRAIALARACFDGRLPPAPSPSQPTCRPPPPCTPPTRTPAAEDPVNPESAELVALDYNTLLLRPDFVAAGAAGAAPGAPGAPPPEPRPPVVTVMGHVDHGKTSLLDALRRTSVASSEAGGITQHIGAFGVTMPGSGASITFLDTPGHAAFGAMRARGAAATDVVVLAVAADDGVMPQTREALAHARAARCPIVVAITKCDLPQAKPDLVKSQLVAEGLELEEYGGDVQVVLTAARKGEGLAELEEALLLQAEVMELSAPRACPAAGVVVEAQVDKGLGPVATVIIHRGELRVGDAVVVGTSSGKVRALRTSRGAPLQSAGPGHHAVVAGLRSLPSAGDELAAVASEARAHAIGAARAARAADYRRAQLARARGSRRRRSSSARRRRSRPGARRAGSRGPGRASYRDPPADPALCPCGFPLLILTRPLNPPHPSGAARCRRASATSGRRASCATPPSSRRRRPRRQRRATTRCAPRRAAAARPPRPRRRTRSRPRARRAGRARRARRAACWRARRR